ncbi:hypothetical protein [Streptomyces maoxianensis]|uniref:hypothetical protein n=1 Tax=Streptomyces maoxianensis TaxID=1459942 RepID=UPI0036D2725C
MPGPALGKQLRRRRTRPVLPLVTVLLVTVLPVTATYVMITGSGLATPPAHPPEPSGRLT